jgi:predicted ATPase/transcriptional regulator with XRE-family HTH domain
MERCQDGHAVDQDASFGRLLRRLRKARDMTQEALAQQAYCAVDTIKKIEAGVRRPSRPLAAQFADCLNLAGDERAAFVAAARASAEDVPAAPIGVTTPLGSTPAAGAPARHSNLPAPTTALIGREAEVVAVSELLRRADVRLVTLTGPGGVGKTRLALQVATELHDVFADGVYFIPLAPIRDPDLVLATIAQALDISELPGQSVLEHLQTALHEQHVLLVLDNVEQVLKAGPQLAALLSAAPRLRLLVTSRVALHLSGEHRYAVPPLALPPSSLPHKGGGPGSEWEALTQYAAVELFVQRARAAMPSFALTDTNALAVAAICRRLDGLPLALELAAVRSALFTPQELLAQLDQRLALLTTGAVDLPTRQQTLKRAIDWSYNLLDEREQALFRRLGVFVGGWTLEAASAVSHTADDLRIDMLEGVTALLDKSLLQRGESADRRSRFTMLETIREYALERLAASGEEEAIRQQHAVHYLTLAEAAEQQSYGSAQRMWLDRLEIEHDNMRAALEWFRARGDDERLARLSTALAWFWWLHGHFSEARRWGEQVLARRSLLPAPVLAQALLDYVQFYDGVEGFALLDESLSLYRTLGDQRGIVRGLVGLGISWYFSGDEAAARAPLEEGLALSRAIGYKLGIADALAMLGEVELAQGDYVRAKTLLEESLLLYRELGNSYQISSVLNYLGDAAQLQGDYQRATTLFAEALALRQELRDRRGSAAMIWKLGDVALKQDNIAQAVALQTESLEIFRDIVWQQGIGWTLQSFSAIACALRRPGQAARLLGAEEALREALGYQVWPTMRADHERTSAAAHAALGEEAFAAAWAAGHALPLEQAIAEALSLAP